MSQVSSAPVAGDGPRCTGRSTRLSRLSRERPVSPRVRAGKPMSAADTSPSDSPLSHWTSRPHRRASTDSAVACSPLAERVARCAPMITYRASRFCAGGKQVRACVRNATVCSRCRRHPERPDLGVHFRHDRPFSSRAESAILILLVALARAVLRAAFPGEYWAGLTLQQHRAALPSAVGVCSAGDDQHCGLADGDRDVRRRRGLAGDSSRHLAAPSPTAACA